MTLEQREVLKRVTTIRRMSLPRELAHAIDAALAENDALLKDRERLQNKIAAIQQLADTHDDPEAIVDRMRRKLEALEKDRERLTWLLEKQDRYLHDDIWEKACEACPVDFDEADKVAKWGRAGIDALMAIDGEVKP